jgi:hypothetical protein
LKKSLQLISKLTEMKRILLLVLLGGIFLTDARAQKNIEIGGFYGYTFNTRLRTYYGDYDVKDASNYGGQLSIGIATDMYLELSYNRMDSEVSYYYNNLYEPLDMSTEYYQIGTLREIQAGPDNIVPFGLVSIGASRFNLKESYGDMTAGDFWFMDVQLGLGTKILLGERLGIRLQARMGLPMSFSGLYIGTGGGGASFYVPMVQFDFTAGVYLRLGN